MSDNPEKRHDLLKLPSRYRLAGNPLGAVRLSMRLHACSRTRERSRRAHLAPTVAVRRQTGAPSRS